MFRSYSYQFYEMSHTAFAVAVEIHRHEAGQHARPSARHGHVGYALEKLLSVE